MRILTGFAYVGMYIVSESWINDKATNSSRGGLLSVYMIVQMLGMMIGQSMLTFGSETGYDMFLAVSIIVSFAAIPIMLTAARSPDFEEPEPASFRRVYHNSPLSVVGMLITGFNAAIVFGMGAVFATKIGMSLHQVSYFMVAIGGGAMILQYPIGKLSDLIDRRTVILITHSLSASVFSLPVIMPVLSVFYGLG